MGLVEQINSTIYCIDCHDLGREKRTGCYVIVGKKTTIIETSASPSIPYILQGLEELQIKLENIQYLILTHIHLDHAGGAGLFLEKCPNATVIVHPKGSVHLADPCKLIASAKTVYGAEFDALFNPILPIPKEKIKVVEHKEQLVLEERTLTFYHTPGHANHHISIRDDLSNGIFTGDTSGIHYHELNHEGISFVLPSTSPNQFHPESMLNSISLFEQLKPDSLYFGHYGEHSNPEIVYKQIRYWLPLFIQCGEEAIALKSSFHDRVAQTIELITKKIKNHLFSHGINKNHPVFEILQLDIEVSSMGLIHYLQKEHEKANSSI